MLFAEGNEYVEQDSTKAMFHFIQAVRPYYKHFSDTGLSPELSTWALDVDEKFKCLRKLIELIICQVSVALISRILIFRIDRLLTDDHDLISKSI